MLATIIYSSPVLAHMGVSEEIEKVSVQIQDNPEAASLYLQRANLHRINQHWPEALADYAQVLLLDPNNESAELGIGRTWLDQGEPGRALAHLNLALSLQPDNVRALVIRARALSVGGNPLAAAAGYASAIDTFKAPHNPLPEYYFERARAFESAGAQYTGAALLTLDAGIGRLGNIRILEDYAVELERKRGNYTAALQRLDRIIDQSARKESLLLARGEILLEQGHKLEAEAAFNAALAAIDALPAQRRHSPAMRQLRLDIVRRQQSQHLSDERE